MATDLRTMFVRKLKRPRGSGVWTAYVLAEDEHGLWLHTPAGSRYRGEDNGAVAYCEVAQLAEGGPGVPIVQLVPRNAWWIATWRPRDCPVPISVDICTPPVLVDGECRWIDLELDPVRAKDGSVQTYDWDEFLAACEGGLISDDEQTAARAEVARVEQALRDEGEPFGRAGFDHLARAQSISLPPLRDLDAAPRTVRPNR